MSKPILELDTLLLIKLHTMSEDQITELLNKYNLSYDGKVWGKQEEESTICHN